MTLVNRVKRYKYAKPDYLDRVRQDEELKKSTRAAKNSSMRELIDDWAAQSSRATR